MAYAEFDTEDHAQEAVGATDQMFFGWVGQKVSVSLIEEERARNINETLHSPYLSTFLRKRDANMKIVSSTVLIKFLLPNSEVNYLNGMLERSTEAWFDDGTGEEETSENISYTDVRVIGTGTGVLLSRMENTVQARSFVEQWNGAYFRSRTVYATLVQNSELDYPTGALFLRAVPKELANQEAVLKLFPGVEFYADSFPLERSSAIIFVEGKKAAKILDENPKR